MGLSTEEKLKYSEYVIMCFDFVLLAVTIILVSLGYSLSNVILIILILFCVIAFIATIVLAKEYREEYNFFPQKVIEIDISRKSKMNDSDLLDYYLINNGTEQISKHKANYQEWLKNKYESISSKKIKDDFLERKKLFDKNLFNLVGIRTQTRYKQVNYQRYPYQVNVVSLDFCVSIAEMDKRIKFLEEHNYNITFNNFNKKDQRALLNKKLREFIKKRDNYTCQLCGKYMPDEVGLHIDHIVPVSKGGKTIPENLRVLCSKCNGKKGQKMDSDT